MEALRRSAWSVALTVGVVSLGWLLLLPWDLSVIGLPGANGDLFERDETRFAFIALMVIVGHLVRRAGLPRPRRGAAARRGRHGDGRALVPAGAAAAAHVVDTNVWLSAADRRHPAAHGGGGVRGHVGRQPRCGAAASPVSSRSERLSGPEAPR